MVLVGDESRAAPAGGDAELGVEAMSLCRYVPYKQALLDGIVELIVLEIDVPVDADGDWEAACRRIARSYRQASIVAFRTIAAYVRGFALDEVTGRALGAQANGSLDPRSLSAEEFPRIAELAPRLIAADRGAEFDRGLELILTGLRAELG